jgi:murein DD-endopeptidase MepM/ murein hydrolase activator NlpD
MANSSPLNAAAAIATLSFARGNFLEEHLATKISASRRQSGGATEKKRQGKSRSTKKGRFSIKSKAATPILNKDLDPACDIEIEELIAAGKISSAAVPMGGAVRAGPQPPTAEPRAVPPQDPVPFAVSNAPPQSRHWPVQTEHPDRTVVSYETIDGQIVGRPGRRFLAQRNAGTRFHVGIDLFANPGDEVVACEDGKVIGFYEFYESSAGEMTFALLVEHSKFVVNYGEVTRDSPVRFRWKKGDSVKSGQSIARVSSTSMTHFETYRLGTTRNQRWLPKQKRPAALLNPTTYLLGLLNP